MNTLDIIIAIPLAYGLIRGLFRGFFKEAAAILAILLGLWSARTFSASFALWLGTMFDSSEKVLATVSYILIFVIVAVALNVLAFFLGRIMNMVSLGWINRLAGGVFGFLKFALILSVLLICFETINTHVNFVKQETINESVLYKPTRNVVKKCLPYFSLDSVQQMLDEQKSKIENIKLTK